MDWAEAADALEREVWAPVIASAPAEVARDPQPVRMPEPAAVLRLEGSRFDVWCAVAYFGAGGYVDRGPRWAKGGYEAREITMRAGEALAALRAATQAWQVGVTAWVKRDGRAVSAPGWVG